MGALYFVVMTMMAISRNILPYLLVAVTAQIEEKYGREVRHSLLI